MSEELEARPIGNDRRTTRTVKLGNQDMLRDTKLCERCICDCTNCNTYNDLRQHGRVAARAESGANCSLRTAGASGSPITSTARRQANLQYTNLRFRQSLHRPGISKHIKRRTLHPHLKIKLKLKNIIKQITTKYLQKIKCLNLTKNKAANRSLFKTNRKIASLRKNHSRRMKKYNVGKTAARLGLTNSINALKASRSFSSSNTTITINSRKRPKEHGNNPTKLRTANLLSKFIIYLEPFFGMLMRSRNTKKSNREKHTSYERPTVAVNYIFPYQSNSSNTLDGINKMEWRNQSSVLNAASDMSSAPNSSLQSLNDQEIQVSEDSAVRNSNGNVEPYVKKLSTLNVYSQCILRPNDVLLQYRNKNAKMIIKKSRRVMFRGHHKRFMTRTYRQNFNKIYHTFLAEIDYTNQPLPPCQSRQGVGIGSTWDVCIDFGRSQDFAKQSGAIPGSGTLLPYQCPPGACVTGKCDPNKCFKQLKKQSSQKGAPGQSGTNLSSTLQAYQCPPGVCVTGACDPRVCFKRLKGSAPYGSHASTQSRKYKLRDQREARENMNGRKKTNMTKRRKIKNGRESRLAGNQIALTPAGVPCRQAVRIGSKCSFNVKLFRETPLGARTVVQLKKRQSSGQNNQGNTSVRRKKKRRPLKTFECEPGICVPGKCSPSECFKQFECKPKVCVSGKCDPSDCYRRQRGSGTETPGSSYCSSQVSTQSRKLKGRDLRAGREIFCKEIGVSSKPRLKAQLNTPNRQAVRIGSKCSFNIEFYKCMPQNGLGEQDRGDTSDGRKGTAKKGNSLKKYQCEPGVCVPGTCNANECFQQLKIKQCTDASLTSQGSQASIKARKLCEKSILYKDKGSSSMPRPKMPLGVGNRQAVRIGSKCSFNIEFYKCCPQNRSAMSEQAGKGKPFKKYQCNPGVCVPGKCNANECFQVLKTKMETSAYDSSMTGSSRGSQATPKRRKDKTRVLKSGKATFYKDTGVSSLPSAKKPLHISNRQAVRIGSTCSFNVEFYKGMPRNGSVSSGQNDQSANSLPRKGKPRGIFECEPGVCIPGKCNPSECFKQFECKPKVCVPGKCDPFDCIQRLRGTPTSTDASFTGSSISTQSRNQKRGKLRSLDKTLYKEKGVSSIPMQKPKLRTPTRQVVRIGSNCSFNIEFFKATSHPMMGKQNYPRADINNQRGALKNYECLPGVCTPGKCVPNECYNRIKQSQMSDQSGSSGQQKSRIKRKTHKYECEPGVCTPGKCNAKECFQLLKGKHGIGNDGSLTDTSFPTSRASQASKKRKSKRPELGAGNAKFLTERGASSMPRSKIPLHLQNRQAVRIGSTCSFNIEFYKGIPPKRGKKLNAQQNQYNIDDNRQYLSSSETSGDQFTGVTCECRPGGAGKKDTRPTGKKERTTGKKERTTEKKERTTEKKERTSGKKEKTTGKKEKDKTKQRKPPAGLLDQGDTTVQQKTTGGKSKDTKRKTKQGKQSVSQNEQGDTTAKPTSSTETKGQGPRGKRTKRKQSQTSVRDQQSESSVNEKVGTGKLLDQGDTPVQRNVETKKTGKTTKKKHKYDQSDKEFEYELGVCIPNKCDPYLCFERLKNRNEGTSTEGSSKLTPGSSDTGSMSKTTSVNLEKKEEAERRRTQTSTSPVYKQKGTSGIATSRTGKDIPQRIPPLGTPSHKKQAVRIGSSCSFNFQIFKDKPLSPAEVASLRSASTPPTPELSKVKTEKPNFATYIKKCCCRLMGQPDDPVCTNGKQHGSQTSQKFDCMQCNVSMGNQSPARFSCMDACTGPCARARRAMQSCCTNAATQSRRCPGLQHLSMNDNSLGAALCKCVAKMGPSRATADPRNIPYTSIIPGGWPSGTVAGYGDHFNRYQVREQAVVIGSGCGFNVNFFKKRK